MRYAYSAIPDAEIPRAAAPLLQHALDTYASETNKTVSVWREFAATDLGFRPHARSSSVLEIFRHQLLSERRFFAEFLGLPEVPADRVLPDVQDSHTYAARLVDLARPRLEFLSRQREEWWTAKVPFFDVERERIWVFWRRVLHSAHHRTQLTVYLRLLERTVPSSYGPTADVTWAGADPTLTVEAAGKDVENGS